MSKREVHLWIFGYCRRKRVDERVPVWKRRRKSDFERIDMEFCRYNNDERYIESFYPKTIISITGCCRNRQGEGREIASSRRKTLKINGKRKQYSNRKLFRIFSRWFPAVSCRNEQELIGTLRKKSEKFPTGILLPRSVDFRCFPAGTGPYFSTWDVLIICCWRGQGLICGHNIVENSEFFNLKIIEEYVRKIMLHRTLLQLLRFDWVFGTDILSHAGSLKWRWDERYFTRVSQWLVRQWWWNQIVIKLGSQICFCDGTYY